MVPRVPDLDHLPVRVHDPVVRDSGFLVSPALGEAVDPRGRWAQHLDHERQALHGGPVQGPRLRPIDHEDVGLDQSFVIPTDIGGAEPDMANGGLLEVCSQHKMQALHHELMWRPGRGGHQQLPVHHFVALAVLRERPHHFRGPVGGREEVRHTHNGRLGGGSWQA